MPRPPRFSARAMQAFAASGLPRGLSVRAAMSGQPAEIMLYDEIGFWGVTAGDFTAALKNAGPGRVRVRINSPGGDVFDGYAMHNALLHHPGGVETVVDGIAASAASFIALAGETVTMVETSMMMIHNGRGVVVGNRHDMRETAGTLDKIDNQIAAIYASKTGKPLEDMAALMDAETWMTSAEAKDAGFCDSVQAVPTSGSKAKASAKVAIRAALLAVYDPDGDGDDDAAEAVSLIQNALGNLTDAIEALTGTDDDMTDAATLAIVAEQTRAREVRARRLRLAESIT